LGSFLKPGGLLSNEENPDTSLRQKTIRGLKFASLGSAGKTVVDIGVNLLLVRMLSLEAFGIFSVAQAMTGLMSCFTDFAGLKFLIRFKEKSPSQFQKAVSSVFWFELIVGIVIAAIWFLAAPVIFKTMDSSDTTLYAQMLAIWIIGERLMIPRVMMDRALNFAAINIGLFTGVLCAAIVMVLMAFGMGGPEVLITGLIVRTFIAAGMMWWLSGFRPSLSFNKKVTRKLLQFGAPLMATTALTFYYTNIDYVIVSYFLGKDAAGVYYNAYRYPHYLIQFNIILGSVAFPAFRKAKSALQFARGLGLITRYAGAIGFGAMLCMWMEGEAIVNVLLGDPEKWKDAIFPFQVFATLAGLRITFTHWGHWFVLHGNTKPLLYAAIFNCPSLTVFAVLGTLAFGIDGAAVGVTVITLLTIFYCCFVLLKSELEFSYFEALKPVLIASVFSAVAFVIAKYFIIGNDWFGVLRAMFGMIIYAVVLWILCGSEILRLYRNR